MTPVHTSKRSTADLSASAISPLTLAVTKQCATVTCPSESKQTRKKACEYCYRVHKRCTGTFPCERCIKAGCATECTEHKRQRHNRRSQPQSSKVPLMATVPASSGFSPLPTKDGPPLNNQQTTRALPPPDFPLTPVLSDLSSLPTTVSYSPYTDTDGSMSHIDSSVKASENDIPVMELLDAWLAGLVRDERTNNVELWREDVVEHPHGSCPISPTLSVDNELWGLIEAMIPIQDTRSASAETFLT